MKLINSVVGIILLSLSIISWAENPSDQMMFHYSGNIIIPSCTVDLPSYTINFGSVNVESLESTGSSTDWRQIHLILSDCTNVNSIELTFSDNASAVSSEYYSSTGTAKHVAVELLDMAGMTRIKPGATRPQIINGAPGIDFVYATRIVNDGSGMATSGTVESVITINYEFK
ncbi:type 1 fimbrial protein [Scandinavium goeteborgense]|uniref:fimbrial protein n=1 Tax=Scandinavium goeteborgense TaxID=1851514 RepID=UPI002165848B|nr:fimbrial protein [Scandinavium goeteborgense]MCS2153790.1 type 1 fimbrial protein [Scandinavium goeteborgense]